MNSKYNFWKENNTYNKSNIYAANETIFRLLGQNKFNFKNKNILDLGMGTGSNLLEFQRRGSNIYGADIRKNIIDKFVKKYNLENKNFFFCDLNKNFPVTSKQFDLIFSKDTIIYINKKRHFKIFNEIYNKLNVNGFFLFQYPQVELEKKNDNIYEYNLSKNYKKLSKYHEKKNPVIFFSNNYVTSLLNKTSFNIVTSIFDVNTYSHIKPHKIVINRYLLLKK